MNWLKIGSAFSWIEARWLRITATLLISSTLLWMLALEDGSLCSKFLRGLFFSLQFIVLNKDLDPGINPLIFPALTLAQFALPFTASVALIGSLFRERIAPYWVRRAVSQLDGHHIVVGYGELGKCLTSALLARGNTVVAVDLSIQTMCETNRSFKLQHDARQPTLVGEANFARAAAIYLLLPDERDNLALLDTILVESKRLKEQTKIHVRSHSRQLGRLFADWAGHKAGASHPRLDVRPFNPFDLTARGLVNKYSPDLFANIDRNGPITQTVMIVGTSAIAESMLLRLARIGIYSPKGKLRVIWAGDGVNDAFARLSLDYPALDPGAHPKNFWDDTSGASPEFLKLLLPPIEVVRINAPAALSVRSGDVSKMCGGQLPAAVYVCHDSDVRNGIEARDLQVFLSQRSSLGSGKKPPQRLILALQKHANLGIADLDNTPALKMLPYEIREESLDTLFAETLVTDRADDLAIGYHAVYANHEKVDLDAWRRERFFIKESNRDLADHLAIKARYAGIDASTVDQVVFGKQSVSEQEDLESRSRQAESQLRQAFDDLVAMEQRRYRAFMFMSGFSHGRLTAPEDSGNQNQNQNQKELDRCLRLNLTLLTEALSDYELSKDSNIVEKSIAALSVK